MSCQENKIDNTIDTIKNLQDNYYSNNKKNIIFKNKQKLDCAVLISDNIPIDILMSKTVYIIPNTNQVFLDYNVFKLFANPGNFKDIVENIVKLFRDCIDNFDIFELHINLDSFTVSALERYKDLIKLFCDNCLSSETRYSSKLQQIYIYNCPKTFDSIISILKPFTDCSIYEKLTLLNSNLSRDKVAYFNSHR